MGQRGTFGRRVVAALGALAAAVVLLPVPATAAAGPPTGSTSAVADWHTLRTPPLADGQIELLTLSTLPDAVTGGDVQVAVRGLATDEGLVVRRNDVDVTDAFGPVVDGVSQGLVTGLRPGENVIEAWSGQQLARLSVVDHPVTGPVLSGPHQQPFRCQTEEAGLGAPLDADCSAPTKYQWFYRSGQDQAFHELADPFAAYPADVLQTEKADGTSVPYVVRVESSTINRGIARIAVLDDPARRPRGVVGPPTGFSGRVYHAFGESCGVGYHQGTNTTDMVLGAVDLSKVSADNLLINLTGIADRLSKGDATVHSTLTAFGVHCNPLISIETLMMIKEHLVEQYGPVEAIVGTNGSGAALQQLNAANNAPGLLAAAMPTATFADIVTTAMTVTDCGLLRHYYGTTSLEWSQEQRAAVDGHNLLTTTDVNDICSSWVSTFLEGIDPTRGCDVPVEDRYDPEDRPDGVRCTIQDANVNIFGRDPATGFAVRPTDNVGVQYGLAALRSGAIDLAHFIDLNRRIGGYDIDGRPQAQRHSMSSETAALAYRIGGVIGRGALDEIPIMDIAPYLDLIPVANIHEAVRPFVVRARRRARNGDDGTHSIWRGVLTQADAYPTMDRWLAATLASRPGPGGDHAAAVRAARPADAADRCSFGTVGGRLDLPAGITAPLGIAQLPLLPGAGLGGLVLPLRVDVPEDFDSGVGPCQVLLPVTATPRMAAGMPLTDDVIKCQRRPIDPADYPGITPESRAQLEQIFPDGVCDFTKPAAEDVERSMIWPSVGGEQLEAPHELVWRVARSSRALPASGESTREIPVTGGRGWAAAGAVALLGGLWLDRLRRRAA